jgi:hypothetical protein
MFNRTVYFDNVKHSLFSGSLSQEQVDGQETILTVWEYLPVLFPTIVLDLRWLAYMLATTYHETAYTIQPITEYGSQSYLQGKSYYPYIGRGYVQLTWDYNYRRATDELELTGTDDLVQYPDRALDPVIAAKVLFKGMYEGWFTGKKLDDYFNDFDNDPVNARQIINGNDDDQLIAGYYDSFNYALQAAVEDYEPPLIPPPPDHKVVAVSIITPVGVDVVIKVNGVQL